MLRAARILLGVSLLVAAWIAGRAQMPEPEFTLAIDAPEGGYISIVCIEGCVLQGARDFGIGRASPEYRYGCFPSAAASGNRAGDTGSCKGQANGWLSR